MHTFRMRVMQWRRGRLAKTVVAVCIGALVLFGLVRHFGMDGDIGSTFNAISAARVSQGYKPKSGKFSQFQVTVKCLAFVITYAVELWVFCYYSYYSNDSGILLIF